MTDRIYFLTFSTRLCSSYKHNTIKINRPFKRYVCDFFFFLFFHLYNPIRTITILNSISNIILFLCSIPCPMHPLRLFFEENTNEGRWSVLFISLFFPLVFTLRFPLGQTWDFSHNKPINFHSESDTQKKVKIILCFDLIRSFHIGHY